MATLITIFNNKGGCSKTTLSVMLSFAFLKSASVGIIDLDPQKSLTNISNLVPSLELPILEGVETSEEIAKQSEKIIIADMPPQLLDNSLEILQASNIIVVPCRPSLVDVVSTVKTYQYIRANTDTKAVVVMTMIESNTLLANDMPKLLKEHDIPLLNTVIKKRTVYASSIANGKNIYKAGNRNAIEEMNELAKEILTKLI